MAVTDLRGATETSACTPLKRERRTQGHARHLEGSTLGRRTRGILVTVPLVIVGSIAITLNLAQPAQAATPVKRLDKMRSGIGAQHTFESTPVRATATTRFAAGLAAATVPRQYTVAAGDTVSGIAGRFGLATASVLALNGLSWKSLIFPGQRLTLTDAAPATVETPVAQSLTRYVVVAGDTISGIAAAHEVSTQSVLSANGLASSSIIFPGQAITIPGPATASAPAAPAPVAGTPAPQQAPTPVPAASVVPFTDEMRANAAVIVTVGRSEGVPEAGLVVALAAAMQESGLRNLDHGDRDSLGLFQQRPSTGWGSPAQIMDPTFATRAFFGGPDNPNAGRTRGLLDIPDWQSMTVTQAAQAVQISAYPDAYAQWAAPARAWLAVLG